jgi:hypothetical protein
MSHAFFLSLLPSCGIEGTNAASQRILAKAMMTHHYFSLFFFFFLKIKVKIGRLNTSHPPIFMTFLFGESNQRPIPHTQRYTLKVNIIV